MRLVTATAAIFVLLASPASTQRGNPTPSQGDESAKLATTYDPTKATVITAADINAAIVRLPNQNSANGTFVEHTDPSSITGLAYRIAVDRRRVPQGATLIRPRRRSRPSSTGAGPLTTGGKMVETKKDGKVVSRAIEGGVSQKVAKGDFVVIPEGVPHYITEANPHVIFIAIEFPRPRSAYPDRR